MSQISKGLAQLALAWFMSNPPKRKKQTKNMLEINIFFTIGTQ
jgi:hypothetical protein